MKFGQLTDYNIRNIFLQKSYTNCDGEIDGEFPDPFLRNKN